MKQESELVTDGGSVHEHDWNTVLHRIDPMAPCAFQSLWVRAVLESLPTRRTNQNFQEVFRNHDRALDDRRWQVSDKCTEDLLLGY